MRIYFFCHSFLSGVQKGIQAVHCLDGMWSRYGQTLPIERTPEEKMFHEWSEKHKTITLLEGGSCQDLLELQAGIGLTPYPWGGFHEDGSLSHALTCVGVLVPTEVYDEVKWRRENKGVAKKLFPVYQDALVSAISRGSLAR